MTCGSVLHGEVPIEKTVDQDSLIIDTDVHLRWKTEDELVKHLPDHFQQRGITPPGGQAWNNPIAEHEIDRNDAIPEEGPPSSSHELNEEQLFGDFGADYAIITGPLTNTRLACHSNTHYAKAVIEAYNDWQIEEWLNRDERYLGSVNVVPGAPEHAVEEIERLGDHDQMVQVQLPGAHMAPYGDQRYWPIYEAAEEAGLPVCVHPGSHAGVAWAPHTGAGTPKSYLAKHILSKVPIMGQLVSIVSEGVFVEYPDLDWVFVEQNLSWLPFVFWNLDKDWKGVQESRPWLDRRPTEYIRENIWFSTQPMPEPEKPEHLESLLDMIHAKETLAFSSDYPHWDNDNPKAIFQRLDDETRRRILFENAKRIYGI